ncbi:hypothetical protein ONE63_004112 [Megalurothrips usitatus]|uniref:FAS1 domain-containing protein n=1 Tax=Megalurothrips usitatus TaxID=439358 RepID=A0AAV7X8N4_9NEOP|nr:hypothetical protein ONE63_004112 [Megalurothrips usitatus]
MLQFRFPDDPRFDPRLHQLSPQQQSQILEDIRQHHRFHQQHQQLQQLQQPQLRPLRPRRPDANFGGPVLHRPVLRPESHQEQSQFNVIPRQPPPQQPAYRFQGDQPVEQPNSYKITLTADKPIVNFHPAPQLPQLPQLAPAVAPVQPVLFVQQPQLDDAALLAFPQAHFPAAPDQPHAGQPPKHDTNSIFVQPRPHKPEGDGQHFLQHNSAEYTKENTIATSSQNYFSQSFNKQPNKIEPLHNHNLNHNHNHNLQTTPDYFEPAATPFPPSRTQPPRSEVIHDLPVVPVTRPQVATEAPTLPTLPPKSVSAKPLYYGDRKQPKQSLSGTPLPPLPKIKFPKELEEEYSLVSVKHLNEAVSEAEHARSTERPRKASQYPQYTVDAEATTPDYSSAIHLQEDRKQLLDQITKAQQAEQAEQTTRAPRPRKTTKPPKEIIEITYQQKPSTPRPPATKAPKIKSDDIVHPPDLQEQLLKQLQEQFSQRKELVQQLKLDPENGGVVPSNILTNTDLLPKNATGPIITSGGQKYQVIQLPAKEAQALLAKQKGVVLPGLPKATASAVTTTAKPPKKVLDELTKGVIPQGADFEIIRKTEDGRLEPVRGVPSSLPDKKVTFVLLEEQNDGSYKVQGVRGNENKESGGEEVDSILKKIKAGEIELPPPSRDNSVAKRTTVAPPRASSDSVASPSSPTFGPTTTPSAPTAGYTNEPSSNIKVYVNSGSGDLHQSSPNNIFSTAMPDDYPFSSSTSRPSYSSIPTTQAPVYNTYSPTTVPNDTYSSQYPAYSTDPAPSSSSSSSSPRPSSYYPEPTESNWQVSASSSPSYVSPSAVPSGSPGPSSTPNYYSQTQFLPTVTPIPDNALPSSTADPGPYSVEPQLNQTPDDHSDKNHRAIYGPIVPQGLPQGVPVPPVSHKYANSSSRAPDTLIDTLKRNTLHAMARFLRQSGLDSILNDTGPYTVFVPTDRAFKTLLVQLGGPDRAEEKFRENPRLLSGLLLHHVIPGAFRLSSLQDEMTGVSLAGTQLRVNTYTTQDDEWNDVQVVTINGAQVLHELSDMNIPQGIAHAVDRVMFPLPVGDLVQTLSADKDRRFATFLRAVRSSGLSDMLTGSKTYTVFAPTERAFQALKDADLARLTTERASARAFVLKHIMPTTFYSAGMRYFQVRESMARGKQITIVNEEGRIKANAALIVTHNIPATNGVVHAIDTLL